MHLKPNKYFSEFIPSFLISEYIQSNFAFASTIYSRSAWQRESRFRLWNTGLCFRGPSGLGARLSCTKNSIQTNYIILCRRMTKLGILSNTTATTTTTTTSKNNWFYEQSNCSASAIRFLVHFFDVHCTTTTWNLPMRHCMEVLDILRQIIPSLFQHG